ncbi:Asp-tRNAAsn/Glu-tRNAGln amidotransferase B subunit [Cenarchaeum symbiosum A]|uniref:Aspartyl/glutamyl-tRNA(Asn/Gln) amidotransferase subunit B n=1 Tax=Cenarchaeum symbiosum (strain A) TaxID=414004 RepID=A0RU63_CENSY|nr:Asp-tRNAAsn/Glu-tRNAGln amidotransferase B subunit [Cenarchaeum symbiosum A]
MIGLEIHCQLTSLNSKLFCPCRADYRGLEPNTNICPVCTGLPGALPLPNKRAIEKAATVALALGCRVPPRLAFFRKNYFYPDLPKNFQITQLDAYGETCAGSGGSIDSGGRTIRIRRVQLEEDPGRIIYEGAPGKAQHTLVDYNRAGVPLVEIVTEPDFEGPAQVRLFLNELSGLLGGLGVADPSLEGALRADGNVSVHGGAKVEVKNVNSFHDLEKALHYEITRQQSLVDRGIEVVQETRQWDDRRRITVSARKKEEETDYRYFVEGDIPWITIDDDTLASLRAGIPEGAASRKDRYASLGIPAQVAEVLSSDPFFSRMFEEAHSAANAKEVANLITTDLMGLLDTREKRGSSKLEAAHLGQLADAVLDGSMTRSSAKVALHEMISGKSLSEVSGGRDTGSISDGDELGRIIDGVISAEPGAVQDAKANPQAINYLLGMVMKETQGRADPAAALEILQKKISS